MKTTVELKYAVKDILIDMALEDRLPLDITDLDIETVFELAEAKLKGVTKNIKQD